MQTRVFGNTKITINMAHVKHWINADICITDNLHGDKFMGNVSIDNRIFTQGPVTKLSDDRYQITPHVADQSNFMLSIFADSIPAACKGKRAVDSAGKSTRIMTATIDGIEYQGSEMIIDLAKNEIQIDGKLTKLAGKVEQKSTMTQK
jgi:hypothetical protein